MSSESRRTIRSWHEPLLGTVIQITTRGVEAGPARDWIANEIDRLQSVFSAFESTSDLSRWKHGHPPERCAPELHDLLGEAEFWRVASRGAFNPRSGALTDLWNEAARSGVTPTADRLARTCHELAGAAWVMSGQYAHQLPGCEDVTLNAIAKGRIVDLAVAGAVRAFDVETVLVNAGGDILHVGLDSATIGIEDPARPYENASPAVRLRVSNRAVATSGATYRAIDVGATSVGHVSDPRSGQPAMTVASATATALDATTADVLATILTVLDPDDGIRFADEVADVGCYIVTRSGDTLMNARFSELMSSSEGGGDRDDGGDRTDAGQAEGEATPLCGEHLNPESRNSNEDEPEARHIDDPGPS